MINIIKQNTNKNDIINKPIRELIQYLFVNDEGIISMIIQTGIGDKNVWSLIDIVNHTNIITDQNKHADKIRCYLIDGNFKIHNADIVIK